MGLQASAIMTSELALSPRRIKPVPLAMGLCPVTRTYHSGVPGLSEAKPGVSLIYRGAYGASPNPKHTV